MLRFIDIANYFIATQPKNYGELLSVNKIVCMAYYAQGYHLAIYNKPLFTDKIFPDEFGPRVDVHLDWVSGLDKIKINYDNYSKEVQELLDETMEVYGQFATWKLAQMIWDEPTHDNLAPDGSYLPSSLEIYFTSILALAKAE